LIDGQTPRPIAHNKLSQNSRKNAREINMFHPTNYAKQKNAYVNHGAVAGRTERGRGWVRYVE